MYNFLLIEDSNVDSSNFQDTIKRLNVQAGEELYHLEVAATYADGMEKISKNLNGIIVDIKLDEGHSGSEIVREIVDKFRVPVAIFTGTPDIEYDAPIKIYKKGEVLHEEILDDLRAVSDTGLFNVLGGTGVIEHVMTQIFWKNLYPQIELWKTKKAQGVDTEKILLRYAVSHIQELIDNEVPGYITEEMYISPPIDGNLKTGSIIQNNADKLYYIVLSPPCDLALHDGKMKTDCVLLCEIEDQDEINPTLVQGIKSTTKRVDRIANALNNNYTNYYHWLPKNTLFGGGYINFRKVITYSPKELQEGFSSPVLKVQEGFVKNILNRFSLYYSRQGQPDFDFKTEAASIIDKLVLAEVK